jgi:hypothetical protein
MHIAHSRLTLPDKASLHHPSKPFAFALSELRILNDHSDLKSAITPRFTIRVDVKRINIYDLLVPITPHEAESSALST